MAPLALLFVVAGCTGQILEPTADSPPGTVAPPNSNTPEGPGGPPPPSPPPGTATSTTTRVVDTLAVACTPSDNLMPDIQRLSNMAYREAVAQLTGYRIPREVLVSRLTAQPRDKTINNVNYGLRVSRVFTSRLIDLTEDIVREMDWAPFFATHTQGCEQNTTECQRGFINRAFRAAIGRTPTAEEVAIYSATYQDADTLGQSFEEASRLVTRALLASPQFIFVVTDSAGPTAPLQRAQRISMLLYNQPNHPDVLRAAADGALDDRERIETYVRAALRDRKISVGLEDFYYDWLNLDRLDYTVDRTNEGYAEYSLETNQWIRRDLMTYLRTLVFEEESPFVAAFTDTRAVIRPETAWIYGDAAMSPASEGSMVDLSSVDKRVGLLTHPAMLTLSLKIETKSIVDRGVFVNEHILCRDIPLPAAVTPIDGTRFPPTASQREKLVDHEQGPCATCHVMLDAPGYALEMFGPIGELKTQDQHGNVLRDDGTFEVDGVESEFSDVFEFSRLLGESRELASCIVQKRLSHALARVVSPADGLHACELERLQGIFEASNYDIKELTVGIATSHYFSE